MKAVFHVNDLDKWLTTFNSSFNCCRVAGLRGQEVELYIIASGPAVGIMSTTDEAVLEQRKRIFEAVEKGIHVCFCERAMVVRGYELPEDLQGTVEVIPSAAIALIDYQAQGFAYIKS